MRSPILTILALTISSGMLVSCSSAPVVAKRAPAERQIYFRSQAERSSVKITVSREDGRAPASARENMLRAAEPLLQEAAARLPHIVRVNRVETGRRYEFSIDCDADIEALRELAGMAEIEGPRGSVSVLSTDQSAKAYLTVINEILHRS